MKTNPVKAALRAGRPQIGTWLSLGSVVAARFMARVGLPWLTVDMEHTHTDIQTAALMFGAIADAGCVPLARVPAAKHEYDQIRCWTAAPWGSSPRWSWTRPRPALVVAAAKYRPAAATAPSAAACTP